MSCGSGTVYEVHFRVQKYSKHDKISKFLPFGDQLRSLQKKLRETPAQVNLGNYAVLNKGLLTQVTLALAQSLITCHEKSSMQIQ